MRESLIGSLLHAPCWRWEHLERPVNSLAQALEVGVVRCIADLGYAASRARLCGVA